MKIKIGRRYITRLGETVGPIVANNSISRESYPFRAEGLVGGVIENMTFTADGEADGFGQESCFDLIAEDGANDRPTAV